VARRRNRKSQPDTASKPDDFGLFKKARLAVISATGGVFLGAYTSLITGYVGPFLTSMVEWTQDHLLPMPADQQIVAEAHFFVTKKSGTRRSGEVMGVALRGIDCLKQGGASDYNLYEFGDEVVYTNALLHATCRPSGKTKVTITPRNGNPVKLEALKVAMNTGCLQFRMSVRKSRPGRTGLSIRHRPRLLITVSKSVESSGRAGAQGPQASMGLKENGGQIPRTLPVSGSINPRSSWPC
jgi:hypothetical protein